MKYKIDDNEIYHSYYVQRKAKESKVGITLFLLALAVVVLIFSGLLHNIIY